MPNDSINYIWMGNFKDYRKELCAVGPKNLAELLPNKEIIMWVPESLVSESKELFKNEKNIQVRSVHRMLNGEYGELKHIGDKVEDIKNTYKGLDKTESFSAQKDLLCYAIIAEYGGYYFDTTTKFVEPPNLPPVKDIKVVLGLRCRELEKDVIAPWMNADAWTFAAEAGHPVIIKALESSLLFKTDKPIGGALAGCLGDGLTEVYGEMPTVEDLKKRSWTKIDESFGSYVPELKMKKANAGSWRLYHSNEEYMGLWAGIHRKAFELLEIAPPKDNKEEEKKTEIPTEPRIPGK